MKDWTRRRFIKTTGAGIVASAAPFIVAGTKARAAPSERVRHAVIGLGGQGRGHCSRFAAIKDCDLVAVCDVDPERRARAVSEFRNSDRIDQYEDYRRIIDDKTIDTISIATADHWHAPIALSGIVAGKHVYVEKPCSHNVI